MNKVTNKLLLTLDKIMPELNLKQSDLLTVLVDHFLNIAKEFRNLEKKSNLKYLYRNELDKACFVHDAAYFDSKDLAIRTISDKILEDGAYEITRNCKYDGYQRVLASMVCKFFYNKSGSGISVEEQLAQELQDSNQKIQKKKSLCEI